MENIKNLHRSKKDRVLFGVCGGFGSYFKIDSNIFRILFIILFFVSGTGVLLYVVLALLISNENDSRSEETKESKKDHRDTNKKSIENIPMYRHTADNNEIIETYSNTEERNKMPIICQECEANIGNREKFCPNCGSKVVRINNHCVRCGNKLSPSDKFCKNCGVRL